MLMRVDKAKAVTAWPKGMISIPETCEFEHPLIARVNSKQGVMLFEMLKRQGFLKFDTAKAIALYEHTNVYLKAYFDGLLLARKVVNLSLGSPDTGRSEHASEIHKATIKHFLRNHYSGALRYVCSTDSEVEFNFSLGRLEVYGSLLSHVDPLFVEPKV